MGTADNDFDALSVTDSGVFSDNDACSSGRSSPVSSCKEGVGSDRDRFAILGYDQVKRVDTVLNEMVALEGRGNFPALELKLKDLLTAVKERLVKEGLKIRDIRLNGGAASFALMEEPLDSCLSCGYQNFTAGSTLSVNRKNSNSADDGLICSCHISNFEPLHPIIAPASSSTDSSLSHSASSSTSQDSTTATSNCCCKSCFSYNDIDLIFGMELSTAKHFDRVKTAVLDAILDLLPPQVSRKRMSPCALKEAYVSKMVKVCDGDRWSLIALGNGQPLSYSMASAPSTVGSSSINGKSRSCSVELKFVDHMRRQYEFSVDSFQIVLDSLLLFYKCASVPMSRRFYPTVVGESVYGDFNEALYHLHNSQMATRHPEEIRGGGLLKYCSLIVRGYRPADVHSIIPLQRYMCSRFFIDFPEVDQQELKLRTYLANHMSGASSHLRYAFLVTLHSVVDSSTVCLMGHERRLTLNLIQRLAYQLYANDYGTLGGNIVYSTYYMPPSNGTPQHATVSITSAAAPGTTLTLGGPSGGGFTCGLDSHNQQTIYYSNYTPTTGLQNQIYGNGCCNVNQCNSTTYQNPNRNGNARTYYNNNNRYTNYNTPYNTTQYYNNASSKVAVTTQTPSASQIKSMTFTNPKASNTKTAKDSEPIAKPISTPTIVIAPPPPALPTSSDTSETIPDTTAEKTSPSSTTTSCSSASTITSPPPLLAITASPSA